MGVFERPKGSGVWWILYYAGDKRRREKVGPKSAARMLYEKRKTQARVDDKLPELNRKRVTFGELLDDTLAHVRREHRSVRDYETKARLLRSAFGSEQADRLTHVELEAWLSKRRIQPATVNRYRAFLSLTYRLGMRSMKVRENPAKLMEHRKEEGARERYFTRDEVTKILAAVEPSRRPAVLVAVYTGMRLSEQFSLEWSQVDWKRKTIRLDRTKNGHRRDVPLNSLVLSELEAIRRPAGLIFERLRKGKGKVYPRWFNKALHAAGITDASWHTNRHTFCSWHALAGTPLKTIQVLAGHKTIAVTARYAHLCPDHQAQEAERIVIPVLRTAATQTTTGPQEILGTTA